PDLLARFVRWRERAQGTQMRVVQGEDEIHAFEIRAVELRRLVPGKVEAVIGDDLLGTVVCSATDVPIARARRFDHDVLQAGAIEGVTQHYFSHRGATNISSAHNTDRVRGSHSLFSAHFRPLCTSTRTRRDPAAAISPPVRPSTPPARAARGRQRRSYRGGTGPHWRARRRCEARGEREAAEWDRQQQWRRRAPR